MNKAKFTTIHCLHETKKLLTEICFKQPDRKIYYILDDIVKAYAESKKSVSRKK